MGEIGTEDKLVMENPGSIRTGKKQMLRGGIRIPEINH